MKERNKRVEETKTKEEENKEGNVEEKGECNKIIKRGREEIGNIQEVEKGEGNGYKEEE